jgi:hypothetical protein
MDVFTFYLLQKTGYAIKGTLEFTSQGLQTDSGCFVRQDVDQPVLELVARQVGARKPERKS